MSSLKDSVLWIAKHKKMFLNLPQEFFNEDIQIGDMHADVRSLIEINPYFSEMYSNPKFVEILKSVVDKYNVSDVEESNLDNFCIEDIAPWVEEDLIERVTKKREVIKTCKSFSNKVTNASELLFEIEQYQLKSGGTGNSKLRFTEDKLNTMLCCAREQLSVQETCEILGWGMQSKLKDSTYRRYYGLLQTLGIVEHSKKGIYIPSRRVIWSDGWNILDGADAEWNF